LIELVSEALIAPLSFRSKIL